ncbi:hypothetical protein [Ancylobacter terrae]|uniref:hypothetical protein n=1 Tax=Ancylobacter sp. sgz301288 TaxID=3342077 RepID=UPI0038591164
MLLGPALAGWAVALVAAAIGLAEWFFLPPVVEASIRRSREARRLTAAQLEDVVNWWRKVIRCVAVSMPLIGIGYATMAD